MRPTFTNRYDLYGAVYDNNLFLRPQSLRGLGGKWRHKDPASLHIHEVADVVELDGDFQYLGHSFGGYGHFILETLPMLAYLMEGELENGIFLSWGKRHSRKLLDTALCMIGLSTSSVHVHAESKILKAKLAVPNRPCRLMPCSPKPRFEVVDNSIYRRVIEKLKSEANCNLSKHLSEHHSRIFLMRDTKRIASEDIQKQLCSELQGLGFHCIYPEQHSFSEQIQFLSKATVIAGFAGSQLHNSIFGSRDSLVIEIGDQRTANQPQIFQELCADIAQNSHQHINYSADPEKIASDIKELIR